MASTAEITSTVLEGRAEMESLMLDRVRITKVDPDAAAPVLDEDTGQYPDVARVTVYEGKCRVQVKADINSNVVGSSSVRSSSTTSSPRLAVMFFSASSRTVRLRSPRKSILIRPRCSQVG